MSSRISAIVGLFVVGASMMVYSQGGPSLQGAWRVTEVVATGPNAEANKNPQPGLYLFTKQHYSIVSVGGTEPRKNLEAASDPAKLTDAEKMARYDSWAPLTANAGTYEVSGSTLTTRPIVAKNPSVMGQPSTREFKIAGKTLTLTQKSADGQRQTTTTLTRVE